MKEQEKNPQPPKWADCFFEWYCNPDLQDEIQGDLYELFKDSVAEDGLRKAQLYYWLNVFSFINKRTLSRKKDYHTRLNTIDMFLNYFKIGYRNILKNKLVTLINAFGMALAIGCALVVFSFLNWMYNTDDFHSNRDEIYVAQRVLNYNGETSIWGDTPEPLGVALKNDFPQIERTVRVQHNNGIFQYEDKVFQEFISFVDPDFFQLFDFPIRWGTLADFNNRQGIVIADHISDKYFGSKNPIGQEISLRFKVNGTEKLERFVIKGVFDKVPITASFEYDVIIPFEHQIAPENNTATWDKMTDITFVQVPNKKDLAIIEAATTPYLNLANEANKNRTIAKFNFQPLTGIATTGFEVQRNQFAYNHPTGRLILIVIVVMLLALVCFNYLNITLASSTARLKEISVRKVMGSNRLQLIFQFLSENLLICSLALFLGVLFAEYLFLPWFQELSGLALQFSYFSNPKLWGFMIVLILLTVLGGAAYPALYISKFEPVSILKKNFKLGDSNRFRKVLVSMQLLLTLVTIFSMVVFSDKSKEVTKLDWGYQQNDLVVVELADGKDYEALKAEMTKIPTIEAITGSQTYIGGGSEEVLLKIDGEAKQVDGLLVEPDYLSTMGITLKAGRFFDKLKETDRNAAMIINETFSKSMNWVNPIGKEILLNQKNYTVIGEVADFRQEDFFQPFKPMVIRLGQAEDIKYLTARISKGQMTETAKQMEVSWKHLLPNAPYNYFFQDGVFYGYFQGFIQVNKILGGTAFLTVIISIIGLFGLAMLLLAKRMKELSIRRILGANLLDISLLINKEFFVPMIFACLVGLPLGYFLMFSLFSSISTDTNIGILPFALTICLLILMLFLSLSKHIYKIAFSNPSNFLRDE